MTYGTPEQPGYGQPGYGQPGYHGGPAGYGAQPGYGPLQPYGTPGHGGVITQEERNLALIAHLGQLVVGLIAPLLVYLLKKDQSAFVRFHAAQSLNMAITTAVYSLASMVLMLLLIGFLTFTALIITWLVLLIMAAVAANRGEWFRYPSFLAWPIVH